MVDFTPNLISFVVYIELSAADKAANQHRRINTEAPVRAIEIGDTRRRFEFLFLPILEDSSLTTFLISSEPNVLILVRIATPIPLHLFPKHFWKEWIVVVI